MAVYTNATAAKANKHGIFRSSRLQATDIGKIYDLIVVDEDGEEIAVDNGAALKVGARLNKGLQLRNATIAGIGDQVAIAGNAPIVKEAFTKAQEAEYNYFTKAGAVVKAYEVLPKKAEVFGVAAYQFTELASLGATAPAFGNYVVVDGKGGYKEVADLPDATTYGFIGQVYGFETGNNETIVLIECVENKQI